MGVAPTLSQLSHGGIPSWDVELRNIPVHTLPDINRALLDAEDAVTDQIKEVPWRFGVEFEVSLSPENSGVWSIEKGERVWRLGVESSGALALNFFFSTFNIPKGGKLFIWNTDRTDFIGAFDHRNNKDWGSLAIGQTAGASVILEYRLPLGISGEGSIAISQIIHSYRSLLRHPAGVLNRGPYGNSGACNINVNCPEGATWATESKSVALILQGGWAVCTGVLVNNTMQDGTPYFLTANHCLGNPNNWIYLFNHEIEGCTGNTNDAPTSDDISGGTLVANNSGSDFALIELSTTPPASFDVQYAGWDASGLPPSSVTGIHHPSGDVKKICFDEDGPGAQNQGGAAVWYISEWELGVTEPGSSGSPLFDQNHRVVGQLYGGTAACSGSVNNGEPDWYGRFDASWDGSSPQTRLRDWLDPSGAGTEVLDGWPEGAVSFANDGAVQVSGIPETVVCDQETVSPIITLTNMGTDLLTSVTIVYSFNGAPESSLPWSGLLNQYESEEVALPEFAVEDGINELEVYITNPNGVADENPLNDLVVASFNAFEGPTFDFQLMLVLDDYGSEVTWEVKQMGQVLYQGGPYEDDIDGTVVEVNLCLEEGCYIFEVNDSYGDGLCCDYGEGSWAILGPNDELLESGGTFEYTEQGLFCTDEVGVSNPTGTAEILVYPNPAADAVNFELDSWVGGNYVVYDTEGRLVAEGAVDHPRVEINVSSWPAGLYAFCVEHQKIGVAVRQVAIIR